MAQYYPNDRQLAKARAARDAFVALSPEEQVEAMIARSAELLAAKVAK